MDVPELLVGVTARLEAYKAALTEIERHDIIVELGEYIDYTASRIPTIVPNKATRTSA